MRSLLRLRLELTRPRGTRARATRPPLRVAIGLLALAPVALCGRDASAQSLRGTVVEEGADSAVAGALVVLVGEDGEEVASVVTTSAGAWMLRAPSPGAWSVRVERIGFAAATAGPFRIAAGADRTVPVSVSSAPVALPAITVESETGTCRLRPSQGEVVFRLWDEASKALRVSALTERAVVFETEVTERVVDPWGGTIGREQTDFLTTTGQSPFVVPPAEDLLQRGFVRDSVEGRLAFYGPDASLLLSDPFLDTHCFRPRRGREGLVGLAFEPASAPGRIDVRGTLWLDGESAELRWIDFEYAGMRQRNDLGIGEEASGRVAFERIEDGGWIVREWRIRVPIDSQEFGGRIYKVYQERSGRVVGTRPAAGPDRPSRRAPSVYDHGARRDTTTP
ncbi:MAG: carboxypeptidase-like regulatory domain-containing protein [Gemmatimonadota bacterium]